MLDPFTIDKLKQLETEIEHCVYNNILDVYVCERGFFHYRLTDSYYDEIKNKVPNVSRSTKDFITIAVDDRNIKIGSVMRFLFGISPVEM